MVVYNRRKRAIYFHELETNQARILQNARDAVSQGVATPAQAALVEGIADEELAMEKKKAERKAPSKILWWLHGDWNEEKELKEQRRLAVLEYQKKQAEEGGVTQAVQEARSNFTSQPTAGGPLDQVAAQATQKVDQKIEKAEEKGKGWLGWAFGGSKKE